MPFVGIDILCKGHIETFNWILITMKISWKNIDYTEYMAAAELRVLHPWGKSQFFLKNWQTYVHSKEEEKMFHTILLEQDLYS